MKILLLGPNHSNGSLPPYLKVLKDGLLSLGADVDWIGSEEIPYDKENERF